MAKLKLGYHVFGPLCIDWSLVAVRAFPHVSSQPTSHYAEPLKISSPLLFMYTTVHTKNIHKTSLA